MKQTALETLERTIIRYCIDCGVKIYIKPYRLRQNPNYGQRCGECNAKRFNFKPKPQSSKSTTTYEPMTVGYCAVCGFYGDEPFISQTFCPKCGMVILEPFERKIIITAGDQ